LKNQVVLISKEKKTILKEMSFWKKFILEEKIFLFPKWKKFVSHAIILSSLTVKNEIHILKNKIDCLDFTLSQCAFNHNWLESMLRKKNISHVHEQTPRHTPRAHHAYTHHTHLYVRVYTCIHCGRKGYLTKLCFNRLYSSNFANKNVWVFNVSNPRGPKKIWIPTSPLLIFDVDVSSHKTWENWCLNGECIWSLRTNPFDASLSRSFCRRTTSCFGEMNWLHQFW